MKLAEAEATKEKLKVIIGLDRIETTKKITTILQNAVIIGLDRIETKEWAKLRKALQVIIGLDRIETVACAKQVVLDNGYNWT